MGIKTFLNRFVAAISTAAITLQPLMAQTVVTAPDGSNLDAGSGNGVPLIMIQEVDANGVSHNVFQQFDVGSEGLILNNNATNGVVGTELGGLIVPNPNITGAAASLILNEVTGPNASQLLGAMEVGGTQADVIVANPYGITCNGCGFINTGNLTLTTGTPTFEGDTFTGLSVDDGTISIGEKGADARSALTFGLISRQLVVGGPVAGQDVRVVLGRNDVVYATGEVTEKLDDGSAKPALSIDSTVLGGMYANAITITSTEDGVGARMPQQMAASAGEMRLTSDGRLVIGSASASGPVRVQATGPVEVTHSVSTSQFARITTLDEFTIAPNATVQADRGVEVTATGMTAGAGAQVVSGTNLTASIDGDIGLAGDAALVAANNLTLSGKNITSAGRIAASGGALQIDGTDITNSGVVYGEDAVGLNATHDIENNGGTILSNANLTLTAANEVRNLDGGTIETISGDILIAATHILNARPDPTINGLTVSTPDGSGDTCPPGYTCDTGGFDPDAQLAEVTLNGEAAQIISGGNITLNATSAENRYSLISAAGNITLNLDTLENIGLGLYAPTGDPTVLEQVGAVFGVIEAAGVIDANVSGYVLNGAVQGNAAVSEASGNVDPADLASDLTSNDLLVVSVDPDAAYLIETDPQFVNPELFLSSDYFLIAVGLDPAEAQKRLGDAYAELLYIRKQLLALAGMLRLQPGIDEVAQIKAMYDNAVNAAEELDLTVGVALTPAQQAALKTDIIWMEEIQVNGQTVLAPRVYLADTSRITLAGGSVLRGAVIDVNTTDFQNSGTLFAEGGVRVNATGTLASSGRIEGGSVILSGNTVKIASAYDRRGNKTAFADGVYGRAAVVSDGDVVIKSAGDLTVAGARIDAGNNAALIAGGALNVTAPALESRRGKPTGKNHLRVEDVRALTSSIRAGKDVSLIAEGQDGLLLAGADVEAGRAMSLIARSGNLVLA
ncbi:two-partner secretion domain-containing protein, partial [Halovulum sp. GXIMD14793]